MSLSEAKSAKAAKPTEADIARAKQRARRSRIIAAIIAGRLAWSLKERRYRDATGRVIPRLKMNAELDKVRKEYEQRLEGITAQLEAGDITVDEWEMLARDELKSLYALHGIVGHGGEDNMSPADWDFIGEETQEQYKYLDNFAKEIKSGKQKKNGRMYARIAMYVAAAHGVYQEMMRRNMKQVGVGTARRELHAAESCGGCIFEASRGCIPIEDVAPIGSQECLVRCKCDIVECDEDVAA